MEPMLDAEHVPALYRSILWLLGELERSDRRPEANRLRAEAVATYGTAWDLRGVRRLEQLEGRLKRAVLASRAPQRRRFGLP
jgi:hypothetical protein